jgi:hypothetical protein
MWLFMEPTRYEITYRVMFDEILMLSIVNSLLFYLQIKFHEKIAKLFQI